jgi:hypothetical protein
MPREPGYYWVTWTEFADEEVARRRPGPCIARWDGAVWWLIRSEVYRFDCELRVLGHAITSPNKDVEHGVQPVLRLAEAS